MSRAPSREDKIKDIKRVVASIPSRPQRMSHRFYVENGGCYSKYQMYTNGDKWSDLLYEACGISSDVRNNPVSNEKYFERLRNFVQLWKHLPNTSEQTKAGLNFTKSTRWQSLDEFLCDAIHQGVVPSSLAGPRLAKQVSKQPHQEISSKNRQVTASCDTSHASRNVAPPPRRPLRRNPKWKRIDIDGMPYAPQDENAVIALFAILCNRGIVPWQILDLNSGKGVDAVCYNETNGRELRVEFKLDLVERNWNHRTDDVDVVVCWQNKWQDFPKEVIELSRLLRAKTKD